MTKALEHLRQLETEIISAVNLRAKLQTVAAESAPNTSAAQIVGRQIGEISRRVVRAQHEIFALEQFFFFDIQRALRAEKYPPLPAVTKSVIRYADESPGGERTPARLTGEKTNARSN